MTTQEKNTLEVCRDIEYQSEQLYLYFAGLFSEDKKLEALWLKTASEERNHALQFELAMELETNLLEAVSVDWLTATTIFKLVRDVLKEMKKGFPGKMEALQAAIKLEYSLARFHLNCVACFAEGSLKEMFNAMMADDNNHVEALEEALRDVMRHSLPAAQ